MASGRRSNSIRLGVLATGALVLLYGCSVYGASTAATILRRTRPEPIFEVADLDGRRVGILVGTILDRAIEKKLDYIDLVYYDDYRIMEQDLLGGILDGIIGDYPVLLQIAADTPGLRVLTERLEDGWYGLALRRDEVELTTAVNVVLDEFKREGILERLEKKWLYGPPEARIIDPALWTDTGLPPLRIATSSVMPPFSYLDADGMVTGYDLELAATIAVRLRLRPVVVDLEFGELIPSLVEGETDVIASCLSITDDRRRVVSFSEGYFLSGVGVMVRE